MSQKIILCFIVGIIIVIVFSFIFLKSSKQQKLESISITPISNKELIQQQTQSLSNLQDFTKEITEEGKQELTKAIASNPLSPKDILNKKDIEFLVENKIIGENEGKWLRGLEKLLTVTK